MSSREENELAMDNEFALFKESINQIESAQPDTTSLPTKEPINIKKPEEDDRMERKREAEAEALEKALEKRKDDLKKRRDDLKGTSGKKKEKKSLAELMDEVESDDEESDSK
jgi:hypothetical protein